MADRETLAVRRAEVRALYESGVEVGEIAQRLGVHPNTVHRDVKLLSERGGLKRRRG